MLSGEERNALHARIGVGTYEAVKALIEAVVSFTIWENLPARRRNSAEIERARVEFETAVENLLLAIDRLREPRDA